MAGAGAGAQAEAVSVEEEHRVWRKNAPYLYDWVSTYQLEWPSLTVQWLPEIRKSQTKDDYETHRLILGTITSDNEPNYLMVAEVDLPSEDAEIDLRANPDGTDRLASRFDQTPTIKTHILHEGEVNRARYMPQNTVRDMVDRPLLARSLAREASRASLGLRHITLIHSIPFHSIPFHSIPFHFKILTLQLPFPPPTPAPAIRLRVSSPRSPHRALCSCLT